MVEWLIIDDSFLNTFSSLTWRFVFNGIINIFNIIMSWMFCTTTTKFQNYKKNSEFSKNLFVLSELWSSSVDFLIRRFRTIWFSLNFTFIIFLRIQTNPFHPQHVLIFSDKIIQLNEKIKTHRIFNELDCKYLIIFSFFRNDFFLSTSVSVPVSEFFE